MSNEITAPIIIKVFREQCVMSSYPGSLETEYINCWGLYGKNSQVYMTEDDALYTHAIIVNTLMPRLRPDVPKENVIGIAMEPPEFLQMSIEFVEYAMRYIGKYYIGKRYELPRQVFVDKFFYIDNRFPPQDIPVKTKRMSIMVSHKNMAPGHTYRHILVQRILQTDLPIDIYGNGCHVYENMTRPMPDGIGGMWNMRIKDPRIKGKFDKWEPYEEYDFHIAIENFQVDHYYSEKIVYPLYRRCTPIYLGCPNIDKYMPNCCFKLTGNAEKDIELLRKILTRPEVFKLKFTNEKMNMIYQQNDFIYNVHKEFANR
jgi:hypothetical protein